MWRSLIWKEWSEQRWKLALGCVILVGFCTICLRSRMIEDEAVLILTVMFGGLLLPVLVAMGVVARELEDGSLDFLVALPVHSGKVLCVKLVVGLLSCWVPLLGVLLVTLVLAGGREITALEITKMVLSGLWWATHMLIWVLAFGMRQPSEARVGLVGISIASAWFGYLVLINDIFGRSMAQWSLWALAYAPIPISTLLLLNPNTNNPVWGNRDILFWAAVFVVVQTLVLVALTVLSFRRFSKLGRS